MARGASVGGAEGSEGAAAPAPAGDQAGRPRPEPRLAEKKWTVDLEEQVAVRLGGKVYEPTYASVRSDETCFVLDTPPPYPSGRWHIGAVAHYSLIDMIARSQRMLGQRVLFPWGLDRNGINIELVVEKKHKKKMDRFDRAEFIDLCREEIGQYSKDLESVARRVGLSCDYEHGYATDSPQYRALTQRVFLQLWREGKVVQDLRPNNYCPDCRTTIADAEVLRDERQGTLVTVRWLLDTGQPVEIATTRPELIAACQAVMVHPEDERYATLLKDGPGAHRVALPPPFEGRSVPLLADAGVDPAFGTGAMMVCSYGDFADVEKFRRHGLEPVAAIGSDGRMTEAAGPLAGLSVKQARTRIIELLEEAGRVTAQKPTHQQVPICERSRTPIEIISLKEWYVRQVDAVADLRRIARELDFVPAKHRQILLDWLDTVTIDWPVSRRRYYHTEIPLWLLVDAEGNESDWLALPPAGPYHQPWRQEPPEGTRVFHRGTREDLGPLPAFLEAHPELRAVGETKVFDTWMDSSNSNLWATRWVEDPAFFERNFPCSLRPQGRDIVRTWLHYTLLKGHLLFGKPGFRHVWISGMGMDEHGRKMSKSLGNVIEPEAILKTDGADAFRFYAASESTIGDDFRISKDRIAGARKFLTKLFNVARFISSFPAPPPEARPTALDPVDAWILAELNEVVRACREGYAAFNFFTPANTTRAFVWNVFAPHYVEMVKHRAYEGDPGALWTLHHVLRSILLLLAPITPFSTHHIHQAVYGGEVHDARLPEVVEGVDDSWRSKTPLVEAFNSEVWKRKKDQGLALNAPVAGVPVPQELAAFRDALVAMHRLEGAA